MPILPAPIWPGSDHREPMEHSDLVGKESSLPPIRLSSCLSPLLSPNSHGINSFADPHPLNPITSILYKNMGGTASAACSACHKWVAGLPHVVLNSLHPYFVASSLPSRSLTDLFANQ